MSLPIERGRSRVFHRHESSKLSWGTPLAIAASPKGAGGSLFTELLSPGAISRNALNSKNWLCDVTRFIALQATHDS
jgi:hypothetical protein